MKPSVSGPMKGRGGGIPFNQMRNLIVEKRKVASFQKQFVRTLKARSQIPNHPLDPSMRGIKQITFFSTFDRKLL